MEKYMEYDDDQPLICGTSGKGIVPAIKFAVLALVKERLEAGKPVVGCDPYIEKKLKLPIGETCEYLKALFFSKDIFWDFRERPHGIILAHKGPLPEGVFAFGLTAADYTARRKPVTKKKATAKPKPAVKKAIRSKPVAKKKAKRAV